MTKLVRYAKEGNELTRHEDIPESISELIYAKEEQTLERRRKRKGSFSGGGGSPIKIVNVIPSNYHQSGRESSVTSDGEQLPVESRQRRADLTLPEPRDEANGKYTRWQCGRVRSVDWKKGFQTAYTVVMKACFDLRQVYEEQDMAFFVENGVPKDIARSFIDDIPIWVQLCSK